MLCFASDYRFVLHLFLFITRYYNLTKKISCKMKNTSTETVTRRCNLNQCHFSTYLSNIFHSNKEFNFLTPSVLVLELFLQCLQYFIFFLCNEKIHYFLQRQKNSEALLISFSPRNQLQAKRNHRKLLGLKFRKLQQIKIVYFDP